MYFNYLAGTNGTNGQPNGKKIKKQINLKIFISGMPKVMELLGQLYPHLDDSLEIMSFWLED